MSPLVFGRAVRLIVGALLVVGIIALALGPLANTIESFDGERISGWVAAAGIWGPVLIISLMTIAIVATPIPSAPIALAAGAAYGHTLGTVYIVAGAELGALVAFGLARFLGRDVLVRWLGDKLDTGWLGSQNALTFTVFASRLMPFISFDIVSYAAGLSRLQVWRFALATLAGIIPASFVLAHFGNEAVSGDSSRAIWAAIGLGALTLTPLLIVAVKDWKKNRVTDG
ncbi:TVP38/TMEM64 family protein [Roseovarius spongiae]|uniref:TVP38/TMEM64 family membrane protein n=1 Tax=Roseovarius spongiae TaxID=2320272 RepID=A0A3A8AR41_9RHOB|nr:VTT domain-containing protein [Roseovarius spongiae]RKF12295.1 TVP38/TMEM64 family protein [Roseovarius spongiae]